MIVVHLCNYASQPSIQISCDQTWTTPSWGPGGGMTTMKDVYLADDGRYYTFELDKVTCMMCLRPSRKTKISEQGG